MSQSFSGSSTHPKSHDQGDALSVPYLISQTARTGGISVPWIRNINGERTKKSSNWKGKSYEPNLHGLGFKIVDFPGCTMGGARGWHVWHDFLSGWFCLSWMKEDPEGLMMYCILHEQSGWKVFRGDMVWCYTVWDDMRQMWCDVILRWNEEQVKCGNGNMSTIIQKSKIHLHNQKKKVYIHHKRLELRCWSPVPPMLWLSWLVLPPCCQHSVGSVLMQVLRVLTDERCTLQGTIISHLGERQIIDSKVQPGRGYVSFLEGTNVSWHWWFFNWEVSPFVFATLSSWLSSCHAWHWMLDVWRPSI